MKPKTSTEIRRERIIRALFSDSMYGMRIGSTRERSKLEFGALAAQPPLPLPLGEVSALGAEVEGPLSHGLSRDSSPIRGAKASNNTVIPNQFSNWCGNLHRISGKSSSYKLFYYTVYRNLPVCYRKMVLLSGRLPRQCELLYRNDRKFGFAMTGNSMARQIPLCTLSGYSFQNSQKVLTFPEKRCYNEKAMQPAGRLPVGC